MFAKMKAIFRIGMVAFVSLAMVACTTVSPEQYRRMSPRQRAQLARQQNAEAAALVGALVVGALVVGAASRHNRGHRGYRGGYTAPQTYRNTYGGGGGGGRPRGGLTPLPNNCIPMYSVPNPGGNGHNWGPGDMCLGQ